MARFRKKAKEYERWILIVVVVVILATISISGLGPQTCGRGPAARDYSGSFLAAPGNRVQVSGDDFIATLNRYGRFLRAFGPTVRYGGLAPAVASHDQMAATWMHVVGVGAARAAGYRVGDDELRDGIRAFVGDWVRRSMRAPQSVDPAFLFSPEVYDRIVESVYGGPKAEFEETFREVLLKDKLFAPLVDSVRFSRSREEAFEAWKAQRERVDLAYVSVPAAQFEERARMQEETRSRIAEQETTLRRVAAAAHRVRSALGFVEGTWKPAHGGAVPKDQAELEKKEEGRAPYEPDKDAWGRALRYEVRDGAPWFSSAGPDEADPRDDVTPATLKHLEALAALRAVGDALVAWQGSAKELPASLDLLTTKPPSTTGARPVPPLNEVPSDPWGKPLVYEREGPVLVSTGPDGERGTPDDLRAEVTADKATVPLPAALEPFRTKEPNDAWGRPLEVSLASASPWRFEVSSAGPDGRPGTEDDLRKGNAEDVETFFNRERAEHRMKMRRSFEAVWVLFPLVPDEAFQAAWAKFPEYRPKESPTEDQAFERFKSLVDTYYHPYELGPDKRRLTDAQGKPVEADPADKEKGHGASVVPPNTKAWLVPAPETLGDRKDVEIRPDDPLHKVYVEKGWRRILLREQFFEAMLNDWLKRARDAQAAHDEWEKGDKTAPEPKLVTFPDLLATVAELRPGSADEAAGARLLEYVKSEKPLTREEWETLPSAPAFDEQVTLALGPTRLVKDGEYAPIPTVVHGSAGRVILRNLHLEPERDRTLEEPGVREALWPRYLASKRMDLAEAEVRKVREAAQPPSAGAERTDPKPIDEAVVEVAKARGFTYSTGTTGLFVVDEPNTAPLRFPSGATEEEKAALRAARVVRDRGYSTLRAAGVRAEGGVAVGTIGPNPVRDEGKESTDAAYLVQVRRREDAPPEELHGERFVQWLQTQAYGQVRPGSEGGFVTAQIARFYEDFDGFRGLFDLKTAETVTVQPPRGR